jgi:hypothetical protein
VIPSKKKRVVVLVDEDNKAWLERQALRYGGSQNSEIVRSIVERREREARANLVLAGE